MMLPEGAKFEIEMHWGNRLAGSGYVRLCREGERPAGCPDDG
jgi:hypothetical protein